MISSIPLSLSKKKNKIKFKKKSIDPNVTFCKHIFFFNLKNRNGLPNNYFLFLVFWKLFLKVRAKHIKYKNYYLKTSFKFNFLKIVLKTKIKILLSIRPLVSLLLFQLSNYFLRFNFCQFNPSFFSKWVNLVPLSK